ncbi:hypothetical protein ACFQDF_27170 [Ectobacillus funiculus]
MKVVIDRVSRLNLLSICEKYLQTDLEHVVLSLYEQYYQDKDIKESFRLLKKDSFSRTKRRWINSAIKDYETQNQKKNKELIGEYRLLRKYYETSGKELFSEQFEGISCPEEVMKRRIEALTQWSNDEARYLTDYLYLHQKNTYTNREGRLHGYCSYHGYYLNRYFFTGLR